MQKSLAFLYTNYEKIEREIKETIAFTIATKRVKYLGIYLPKETKDLYIENYKTLVKDGLLDSEGEEEDGMIWENSTETCILSCKKRSASLCSIQDTGCLGLVHGDDPER